MRRILVIILAVLLVIAVVVAVWYFFLRPKTPGITVGTGQNPFGETGSPVGGGGGTGGSGSDTGTAGTTATEVAPHLFRITDGPVAYGEVVRNFLKSAPVANASSSAATATTSDTEVRYVERQSGNLFSFDLGAKTLARLSNRTLPGIEEASWAPDGSMALLRFLSDDANGGHIDTFALPESGEGGFLLEQNLSQAFVAGSSTLVTLLPSSSGSIATAAKLDGTSAKTVFSSPVSSLRLFPAGKGYFAYTKASSQTNGYGFVVGADGSFDRALGPLRGLTALPSPSGKAVAYSYLSGSAVTAGLFDTTTRAATSLPVAILPEKCVWAADEASLYCAVPRAMNGTWPDAWYEGTSQFSDRIWKIDLAARTAILVVDPAQVAGTDIDAVSLAIDPQSDLLVFVNRRDGSLWAYDL